jgi:hypothetical protein
MSCGEGLRFTVVHKMGSSFSHVASEELYELLQQSELKSS